jgi:hypothetical protein
MPTVPQHTVIGAHTAALALTAAVMWTLHVAEHGGLVVISLGAGVYVGVLGGMLMIATRRARVCERRQRENFAADVAERNERLHGDR